MVNSWLIAIIVILLLMFCFTLLYAFCTAAKRADEQMEEFNKKEVEDSIDE